MIIGYCSHLCIPSSLSLWFPLFTELNTSSSVANFSLGSLLIFLNPKHNRQAKWGSLTSVLSLGFAFKRTHCLVETLWVKIWPCTGISYQWFSTLPEKTKQGGLGEHSTNAVGKHKEPSSILNTPAIPFSFLVESFHSDRQLQQPYWEHALGFSPVILTSLRSFSSSRALTCQLFAKCHTWVTCCRCNSR